MNNKLVAMGAMSLVMSILLPKIGYAAVDNPTDAQPTAAKPRYSKNGNVQRGWDQEDDG